jgi:4-aminobutyrate aminotransferase-like enzyme
MAAHIAALEVMAEENAPQNAEDRGRELVAGMEALAGEHPWIGEVRGKGLILAMELVEDPATKKHSPQRAKALLEAAKVEGLLLGLSGLFDNVVRVAPSLLVTADESQEALDRLGRACALVSRETP